jgi:hypothetical protein
LPDDSEPEHHLDDIAKWLAEVIGFKILKIVDRIGPHSVEAIVHILPNTDLNELEVVASIKHYHNMRIREYLKKY